MRADVLNAVVIKGVAEPAAVVDATDLPLDEVEAVLAELAEAGLLRHRTGRLVGWTATAAGRDERTRLMRQDRHDPTVEQPPEAAYQAFLTLNGELKRLCVDWQTIRAGTGAPAAVTDGALSGAPVVDPAVQQRLDRIHRAVLPTVVEPFAKARSRFAAYGRRLNDAAGRFTGGDLSALTAARPDSYHGVWMELHADILATCDRERGAADGA